MVPIAIRRTRRENIQPPERYRDVLPCPSPNLPPDIMLGPQQGLLSAALLAPTASCLIKPSLPIRSPPNIFGLVRQYAGYEFPSHDAEDYVTFADLCNRNIIHEQASPTPSSSSEAADRFFPYPNLSSFHLGNWFWSGGAQKSQAAFRELIKIVGDPDFVPSDVHHNKWDQINALLADNIGTNDDDQWVDAADEGWHVTDVEICVPFHSRAENPGMKIYSGIKLYHRSLVAVMKERFSDPHDFLHFHIEPHDLLWKSPVDPTGSEFRVHGELYTSQSFLRAHSDLQQSPREPGCQLEHVICAFMLWSDATHLTSFGNARLWPIYLYFGNESKYRRGKPILNSCNHVAYFEKVWTKSDTLSNFMAELTPSFSYHLHSMILPQSWQGGRDPIANSTLIATASFSTSK